LAIPIKAGTDNIGFSTNFDSLTDNLHQMLMPEKLRRVRLGLVVERIKTISGQTGVSGSLSELFSV